LITGGQIRSVTNSWIHNDYQCAIRVPITRQLWSGSEMIVWGGNEFPTTGWKIRSEHNSWTDTTTSNAPEPDSSYSSVDRYRNDCLGRSNAAGGGSGYGWKVLWAVRCNFGAFPERLMEARVPRFNLRLLAAGNRIAPVERRTINMVVTFSVT